MSLSYFQTTKISQIFWIWPILILSRFGGDCRHRLDWWMDLLTTYTHYLELEAFTAPSLICTIHKSLQHSLSLFAGCCFFISCSVVVASNSGDSSASCTRVLSSQPPMQNSTLNWLLIALTLLVITSQHEQHRKHCSYIVACIFIDTGTRCPETGCMTAFIKNLLTQQWASFYDIYPATVYMLQYIYSYSKSLINVPMKCGRLCVNHPL
jgi:hypothetical protein